MMAKDSQPICGAVKERVQMITKNAKGHNLDVGINA